VALASKDICSQVICKVDHVTLEGALFMGMPTCLTSSKVGDPNFQPKS
jgi:hypothetical protein